MTVRSISSPRDGWTLQDAVRLAEQGYQLEQVQRTTGYAPAHVRSHLSSGSGKSSGSGRA